jgi:hypothetical protein
MPAFNPKDEFTFVEFICPLKKPSTKQLREAVALISSYPTKRILSIGKKLKPIH